MVDMGSSHCVGRVEIFNRLGLSGTYDQGGRNTPIKLGNTHLRASYATVVHRNGMPYLFINKPHLNLFQEEFDVQLQRFFA